MHEGTSNRKSSKRSYEDLPPSDPPEHDSDDEAPLYFPSSPTPMSGPSHIPRDEIILPSDDSEVLLVDYMRELKHKAELNQKNKPLIESLTSSTLQANDQPSNVETKTPSTTSVAEQPLKTSRKLSSSNTGRARRLEETRLGPAASTRQLRSKTKKDKESRQC